MNKCLRKQEDINNIIIYKARCNSQLPHQQRKKEFFSIKNAEEERNMPWPKLKKKKNNETWISWPKGALPFVPENYELPGCMTIYAAWPRYCKTAISQNHDFIWTSCWKCMWERSIKQTAFKSHLWGLKATNSVNQRPEHCSGSYKRPEINAI